jgi:hypothetical protein
VENLSNKCKCKIFKLFSTLKKENMGYKKVIATLEKEIKSGKYEAFLLIDKVKDILLFYLIYFNNIFGYCFNKF